MILAPRHGPTTAAGVYRDSQPPTPCKEHTVTDSINAPTPTPNPNTAHRIRISQETYQSRVVIVYAQTAEDAAEEARINAANGWYGEDGWTTDDVADIIDILDGEEPEFGQLEPTPTFSPSVVDPLVLLRRELVYGREEAAYCVADEPGVQHFVDIHDSWIKALKLLDEAHPEIRARRHD